MILSCIFWGITASAIYAQDTNVEWMTYSPPNGGFSFELMKSSLNNIKVEVTKTEVAPEDIDFYWFGCNRLANKYVFSALGTDGERIQIWDIDLSKCNRQPVKHENEIYAFLGVWGKDGTNILSDRMRRVNGWRAREIVFKDFEKRRLLIVDTVTRLYALWYSQRNGNIAEEDRVFKTFATKISAGPAVKSPKDKWKLYNSPDKSFSVELPATPARFTSNYKSSSENMSSNTIESIELTGIFRRANSINYYYLPSLLELRYTRLVIREIIFPSDVKESLDSEEEKLQILPINFPFKNYITVIKLFSKGWNPMATTMEESIKINGLEGSKIVFDYGIGFRRTMLIVNGGKRIFTLTYDREEGSLEEEERILRTFKPILSTKRL